MGCTAVGAMVGLTGRGVSGVVVGAKTFPIDGGVEIMVGGGRIVVDFGLCVSIGMRTG